MKYCSKCGNELLDEAVICPKCGCPVESGTNQNNGSKLNKIKTALVLNIIAFVIAAFTVANYLLLGSSGSSAADQNTNMLLLGLLGVVTLSFVLCIINMVSAKKGHARAALAWIYVISVVLTTILFAIFSPVFFFAAICGYGILFPVPPILQIIAAVKLIQATKE